MKQTLQVYRKIDQRGRELERLLNQYDMHLASPPLYKLKYVPENYTFIDVTLGGEDIQFHDWKFWEDSLSDHPYVFFQVTTNKHLFPLAKRDALDDSFTVCICACVGGIKYSAPYKCHWVGSENSGNSDVDYNMNICSCNERAKHDVQPPPIPGLNLVNNSLEIRKFVMHSAVWIHD